MYDIISWSKFFLVLSLDSSAAIKIFFHLKTSLKKVKCGQNLFNSSRGYSREKKLVVCSSADTFRNFKVPKEISLLSH